MFLFALFLILLVIQVGALLICGAVGDVWLMLGVTVGLIVTMALLPLTIY